MANADSNVQKPTTHNFRDLEGQRFGRWLVLSYSGKGDGALWLCRCDCGKTRSVKSSSLQSGRSQSCGCRHKEMLAGRLGQKLTHGKTTCGERPPEYRAWSALIQRCTNPKVRNYGDYGGRGITVCDRWRESFEAFFEDVGLRPSDEHSLDRYPNNDGNYEPGNVRWATDAEQRDNSRHPRRFEYEGQMFSIADISTRSGIPYGTLRSRLMDLGWTVERAVTQHPRLYHDHAKLSNSC